MSKKILIVEDDKNINIMIQLILKNKKLGWELRSARDGVEALEILASFTPDLALIDLALPTMDGTELIRKIRAKPELAGCKLAVLTSVVDEAIKNKARTLGASELWMKPIMPEALFSNISAMLT